MDIWNKKKNEILKKENEKLIALSNRTCPDVWNENIKLLYDVTQKDAVIELLKKENKYLKERGDKWKRNAIELNEDLTESQKELETYYEKEKQND